MRWRVCSDKRTLSREPPLSTDETAVRDTPALTATSDIVTIDFLITRVIKTLL
jgi:hypothetical protein